jgi:Protein of unknown function (DUF3606)
MEITMYQRSFTGARNKLDLSNRVQVRIVRKRLKVSEKELSDLVRKAGDSAVRKEAGSQRLLTLPKVQLAPVERSLPTMTEDQAAQL